MKVFKPGVGWVHVGPDGGLSIEYDGLAPAAGSKRIMESAEYAAFVQELRRSLERLDRNSL